jgi:hypothetical protein
MTSLISLPHNAVLEQHMPVADDVFSEEHKPYGAELKKYQKQVKAQVTANRRRFAKDSKLSDDDLSVLHDFACAALETFLEQHPYLRNSAEVQGLVYRFVVHFGPITGQDHVDMLLYLRLGLVFCLKTSKPYTVRFQSHDKSHQFGIKVKEGDVYTLNEARANDCSHQVVSVNDPGDVKISLVWGYFTNKLKPLLFDQQKAKWGELLDWNKTKHGKIWPVCGRHTSANAASPISGSSAMTSVSKNSAVNAADAAGAASKPQVRCADLDTFSTDELGFIMKVLTGDECAVVLRSFDDVCGHQ